MDDGVSVELIHGGHDAVLELQFGCDADMAQHRGADSAWLNLVEGFFSKLNLRRAAAAGLAWPLADGVTDEALETRLFGRAGVTQGQRRRAEPDWAALAREQKRPGVTMTILWEEYREVHPEGYGYSRYVAARFMLRERLFFAGRQEAGAVLTQHNPARK